MWTLFPRLFLALSLIAVAVGCADPAAETGAAPATSNRKTVAAASSDGDLGVAWTQWGGPRGTFEASGTSLADEWPESGPRSIWKRALGQGYSGIVTDGTQLFTMYRDVDDDVIIALDASDGKTLWERRYPGKTYEGNTLQFGSGPNASPLLLGDRLVTLGYGGMLQAVSRDKGEVLWSHDLIGDLGGAVLGFGYSASPVLLGGKIVVLVGGEKHAVVGLDPEDGSIVWKSAPGDVSYATPILIDVGGQEQIVYFAGEEIIGIDAGDGSREWSFPCKNQYSNNATPPHWGPGNLLWVATQLDGGTRVLHLTRAGDRTAVEEVWSSNKMSIHFWNTVLVDDHIFGSFGGQGSVLSAIDLRTGKVRWQERGFSKVNWIHAGDKLILLDEAGQLALARASAEKLEILGQTQLVEGKTWTMPTLSGTTLFVRDTESIMALDLGANARKGWGSDQLN